MFQNRGVPLSSSRTSALRFVKQLSDYEDQVKLAPQAHCAAHFHPEGPTGLIGMTAEMRATFCCSGHLIDNVCNTCNTKHGPRPIHIAQGLWPIDNNLLPFPIY